MTGKSSEAIPVDSTLLASVSYDGNAALLNLEFRDGAVYCYFDVPSDIHEELLGADSKGAYFNRRIRGRFPFDCLRRPA